MKLTLQNWITQIRRFVRFVYGPTPIMRPKTKAPPTGWAFDLTVVTLFLVLGLGVLVI